jgi:hypothetical protein
MGVFARLLRRSKATEEAAPAAEAGSDTAQAGSEAAEAASTAEVKAAEGTPEAAEPTVKDSESAKGTESEGVDIPKQQSTDKAADNEAGDSART